MKNFFFLIIGLIVILGSIFIFLQRPSIEENLPKIIEINGKSLEIEVADTNETRIKGLSGRENLSEGAGMLFVFENEGSHGIWMKDMNFSIDIVWINEEKRVIGVERDVSPETYPHIFYPPSAVRYVLELPANSSENFGIEVGVNINLETETVSNQ